MLQKISKTFFKALTIGLCISSGSVLSQTLPLSSNLVGFNTPEGGKFLVESKSKEDFFPLSMQFITQNNQAYCGVASIVYGTEWSTNSSTRSTAVQAISSIYSIKLF